MLPKNNKNSGVLCVLCVLCVFFYFLLVFNKIEMLFQLYCIW